MELPLALPVGFVKQESQQDKIMSLIQTPFGFEWTDDECPHDENDHGICLDCGKDINDDLVAAAEFAADCREDR